MNVLNELRAALTLSPPINNIHARAFMILICQPMVRECSGYEEKLKNIVFEKLVCTGNGEKKKSTGKVHTMPNVSKSLLFFSALLISFLEIPQVEYRYRSISCYSFHLYLR